VLNWHAYGEKDLKNFTIKRICFGIFIILVLAIAYFVFSNLDLIKAAPIGAGYKAKILCSGIFVSFRDEESILSEDLSYPPDMNIINAKVDYENKSVTASVFGIIKKKAIYRAGQGCTILSDKSEAELRSQSAEIPAPLPENPETIPWPTGDLMLSGEIPPHMDRELLDEATLKAFFEHQPERPRRTRAVVVVYDGKIISEHYAPGFSKNSLLLGWSMTKSVTNALVGILVGQGKLSIHDPAPVPEWRESGDPRGDITLDQLLRMSSGLKFLEAYADNPLSDVSTMLFHKPDTGAFAANMPLETKPDQKWSYSSGTTNIISRVIRQTIGNQAEYASFPRRALFNRIGMRSAVMEMDASGTYVGSSYMYATARDWARFGLLYLNDGVWEGERILPEGWVAFSSTPTSTAPQGLYGAHFWLNRGNPNNPEDRPFPQLPTDMFLAQGVQGQTVVIIPSYKLVIVRLGMSHYGDWGFVSLVEDILHAIKENKI